MRVISQYIVSNNDAGPKAKIDVEKLLRKNYNAKIYTNKINNNQEKRIFSKIKKFLFSYIHLKTNETTVIQIPYTNKCEILNLSKNKIGIIHDVNGLRYNDEKLLKEEIKAFNQYNGIIVHNDVMKNELIKNGLTTKTVELKLFDYLIDRDIQIKNEKFDAKNVRIAYPGNLEMNKAKFVYELEEENMNFKLCLYGDYLEKEKLNNKKIEHKGSFSSEKLIENLNADLGLVWSGKIDESDQENGEKGYTRYNMPHKLSCFLAAGIPVIVWEKSAAAQIIDEYNVGYKINNIYDINKIDFKDYDIKKENAIKISEKIRNGYFTQTAINDILKMM